MARQLHIRSLGATHWIYPLASTLVPCSRAGAVRQRRHVPIVPGCVQMGFTPDKAWADEFLRATFHKLPSLGSQGLTNVIWALAVMPLRPPPAWLYAFVKVCAGNGPGTAALRMCSCTGLIGTPLPQQHPSPLPPYATELYPELSPCKLLHT